MLASCPVTRRTPLLLLALLSVACHTGDSAPGRTIEDCAGACWLVAAANCQDIGSECVDVCLRGSVRPGTACAELHQEYLDCFWETPEYTCDAQGFTRPTTCDAEFDAWQQCRGADAGITTDAGSLPNSDAAIADGDDAG